MIVGIATYTGSLYLGHMMYRLQHHHHHHHGSDELSRRRRRRISWCPQKSAPCLGANATPGKQSQEVHLYWVFRASIDSASALSRELKTKQSMLKTMQGCWLALQSRGNSASSPCSGWRHLPGEARCRSLRRPSSPQPTPPFPRFHRLLPAAVGIACHRLLL